MRDKEKVAAYQKASMLCATQPNDEGLYPIITNSIKEK